MTTARGGGGGGYKVGTVRIGHTHFTQHPAVEREVLDGVFENVASPSAPLPSLDTQQFHNHPIHYGTREKDRILDAFFVLQHWLTGALVVREVQDVLRFLRETVAIETKLKQHIT